MPRTFQILNRVVLVLGVVLLSFKPSVTNRIEPGFFHPNHIAFAKFASFEKQPPFSHHKASWRSSFHKDEEKHFDSINVAAARTTYGSVMAFQSSSVNVVPIVSRSAVTPSLTAVLRI